MSSTELKIELHKYIDRIDNNQLLQTLYGFLRTREEESGELWNALTEAQKQEVLLSYDESKNEENLVSREEIFKKK